MTISYLNQNHGLIPFLQRVNQALKRSSSLVEVALNLISACASPVITFTVGVIRWLQEELNATDIVTRELLTMYGGSRPNTSTLGPFEH